MKIFEKIMQHIDLLSALTSASNALLTAAQNRKFEIVEQIVENRERLLNVIKTIQTNIEDDIAKLHPGQVTREEIEILKSWSQEVNQIVMINDKLDRDSMILLEQQKEETTKEIATVFTNRQSFKGYDLSNVKK